MNSGHDVQIPFRHLASAELFTVCYPRMRTSTSYMIILKGRIIERERPSLLDLLSGFGLISDGWLGSISLLEIGPMHLEC